MNILIITYEFPPIGGGTGKASYYTGRELVRMGHNVGVLTLRFKGQKKDEMVSGMRVFRIPALRKRPNQSNIFEVATFAASGVVRAGSICNTFKPAVTLAYFTIPSGVVSLWLKYTRGIPFLTLLRGQDVPGWLPDVLWLPHM
ncbi:MAG: glycosyltransferase, partial [Candidatus Omnitrophota bacterium]